jgi:tetratricopeptide (TPR) repeat protein
VRSFAVIAAEKPPYPGLRPFERDESHLFFGRDKCVDQMIARLAERRFLAVLGSSGTGKSSLVKTGLFSGLEMGLLSGAGSRWLITEFRPGGSPLGNLARALLEAESKATKTPRPTDVEVAGLQARFKQEGPRELIKWCQEGHLQAGINLLVLVDQFEELFRYQNDDEREEAQALVSLLLESRWPRGVTSPRAADIPIYVTITMRSEYLGACTLLQGLAEAINEGTFLTPRMKRQECEEAIVGPARVCGSEVEPRLVTRLLNDMADFAPWDMEGSKDQLSRLARRADQLPLMQHALNQMWRRARRQRGQSGEEITLKLADYCGLEQELDNHAEEVFGGLDKAVEPTAKRVFQAVTLGTTVANAVRRPTEYRNLVNICGAKSTDAVAAVMAAFGPNGCQFLTSDRPQTGDRPPDDAWIDIAHESLIRQWKRLSGWLEQEGRWSREWQQLKGDTDQSWLLSGRRLKEAVQLRREAKPTSGWAERNGGGFDRITWLIPANQWLRRGFVLIAAMVVGGVSWAGYDSYEQRLKVGIAKETAVTSAQMLLDHLEKSVQRSEIGVNAANNVLQVAKWIVERQIKDIERTPKNVGLLVDVGCKASDIHAELGDYTEAYNTAKEARDLTEPLQKSHPDDPEVLRLLYITTWRIGDAISYRGADPATQGRALKEYRDAETLARGLAMRAPEDRARRRELMFVHQKIGDVHQTLNKLEDALAEYQTALTLIQKVVDEEPQNRIWRRDLANSIARIGQLLSAKGDLDGALKRYYDARDIRTELAKEDPSDAIVQSNLASNHRFIAMLFMRRDEVEAALTEYRRAIEIQQRLIDNDPSNATWQFSLATFRSGMAGALRRKGELAAALEQSRYAYAIRQALVRKDPSNPSRQVSLALAAISVADLLSDPKQDVNDAVKQKQNLDDAMKLYRDAIEALDETKQQRYDSNVFDSYIKIGDILNSRADRDDALKEYKVASGIALGRAAGNPDSVTWQRNLAISYIKIGDVLAVQERSREAIEHYQKALDIVTALAAKYPQVAEWRTRTELLNEKIAKLTARP